MGRVKQQGGRRGGDLGVPGVTGTTTGATPRSLLRRTTGHYVNLRLVFFFAALLAVKASFFFFTIILWGWHLLLPSTASISHVTIHPESKFFFFLWKQDNNNEYTQTGKKHSLLNLLKNRNSFYFFFLLPSFHSGQNSAASPPSSYSISLSHTHTQSRGTNTTGNISAAGCNSFGECVFVCVCVDEWVYPASIDYSCLQREHTISQLICRKENFVSTFQTAPAQENPSTGKTLKKCSSCLLRVEEKNKTFFCCFFARWAHFFDFIARSHTLLFFSFLVFFSLLTIGLLLHTQRAMWL